MYYEVVYEDGTMSIADFADDAIASEAILAANDRAKNGEPNGPQGANATRVAAVYVYANHPGDFGAGGGLSVDEVKASINEMLKDVQAVDVQQLAVQISALNHPMNAEAGAHDSKFRMEADRELELELA